MNTIDSAIQAKINQWLTPEYDVETVTAVQALIDQQQTTELVDSFYKDLEFGTGGLRGIMGVGTNRMAIKSIGMMDAKLQLHTIRISSLKSIKFNRYLKLNF